LPVNFLVSNSIRDPYSFVVLSAGVSGHNQWDLKVNGSPANQWRVTLDGQDAGSSRNTGSLQDLQPSVDAIEEFTLQTSNFAAEFGQVGAGLINMTTRSGTNEYHGSVYETLANEAFNARRPYAHVRPKIRMHDWGFKVGGPVRIPKLYNGANRTFFYFNFEQYRNKASVAGTTSVPSDAYRNGDLSYRLTGKNLGTGGLGTC
jgi:hypothetical protein